MFKADLSDAAADDAIDVVVVGRFALDHAAQADDRIKLFSFYQPQRRVRQLPRTGNPENRNIVFGDAIAQQGLNGTIFHVTGDVVVVLGHDNRERFIFDRSRFARVVFQNCYRPLRNFSYLGIPAI